MMLVSGSEETELEGNCVVLTSRKLVKQEALRRLREVMARVHARNPDANEEDVIELALKAIEELRKEAYAKQGER